MASLGETLRQARLERGVELAELSARTKINIKFLEAIEANRREELPGRFFFRSWVGQCARALDLDEAVLVAEADRLMSRDAPLPLPGESDHEIPNVSALPVGRRGTGEALALSFGFLALVVIGCSGLYVWWHKTAQVQANAVPEQALRQQVRAKPSGSQRAPIKQAPATVSQPAAAALATPSAPTTSEFIKGADVSTQAPLQVELAAAEPVWISILSDGKLLFSGTLSSGDTKKVDAEDLVRIRAGNAGGLTIHFNGKALDPIGPRGQIRTVTFSRDGVQVLAPPID